MDNTVTVAETQSDDIVLSDEMKAEIIRREKYMQQHPDEWITAEESIRILQKRISHV